ncbi:hypothetical protein D3C76_1660680 [compost metagenome]
MANDRNVDVELLDKAVSRTANDRLGGRLLQLAMQLVFNLKGEGFCEGFNE